MVLLISIQTDPIPNPLNDLIDLVSVHSKGLLGNLVFFLCLYAAGYLQGVFLCFEVFAEAGRTHGGVAVNVGEFLVLNC